MKTCTTISGIPGHRFRRSMRGRLLKGLETLPIRVQASMTESAARIADYPR
jgi:hypothetical protein